MADTSLTILVGLFKGLAFLFDVVTFVPYYFIQRPDKVLQRSRRLKATPANGDPAQPWRSVDIENGQLSTSLVPDCRTLAEVFDWACKRYYNLPCLGTRQLISEEQEVQPSGKVFKKLVLGEYDWLSYEQVGQLVSNIGRGLLLTGQQSRSRLVIYAETRAEWMIFAQACFKYNFQVVTLYATLGVEALVHGITETQVTHVVTSLDLLPKFKDVLPRTPSVTHIVVMVRSTQELAKVKVTLPEGVKVLTMGELETMGSQGGDLPEFAAPLPHDVAIIMYTSGSTGVPKGVMISNSNVMAATSGLLDRIPDSGSSDIYIGYLPLAHVLELAAELSCMTAGIRIGYSSPNTLTDKSSKIKRGAQGDVSVLQPTLVAAVPVIIDRIYKDVWDKVNSSSLGQRALFHFAYGYKQRYFEKGYSTPLCDKLVFSKVKSLLGGRVRLLLCGGAPLSAAAQRFISVCICCPVGQGYGLTETCGAGAVLDFDDLSVERVGAPVICSEVLLRSWPEGNYLTSNTPHPQGEILIGGDNVTLGYFNNLEKTSEDYIILNDMRYFCTGDIGQFEEDGCLRIIDRKKDLVKLQHGEYVSLAQIETVLSSCPLVEQVCAVASSSESSVVALVVPSKTQMFALQAKLHGEGQSTDFTDACKSPDLVKAVQTELSSHGLKGKLQRSDIPTKVTLLPDAWTTESGLVTDAFKLKRKAIEEKFHAEIAAMYNKS